MEHMRMDVRTTQGSLFSYSTSLWVQGSMQVIKFYGKYFNLLSYLTSTSLFFIFFLTKLDFDLQNWFLKNTYLLCVCVYISYHASLGRMTFTILCISVWRHMCNTMQMKVGGNITLCVCMCACVHMCHTM